MNINNNLEFKDKLCDQLSEFEELRAVGEIYKHDDEIREQEAEEQHRQKQIELE